MNSNFAPSLAAVLQHEGGYSDDLQDPGGATNQGVTQAVYDGWRDAHDLARSPVRGISATEVEAIYRQNYWTTCRCDDLPSGVDYCVFDFGVNSGVSRAARYLQRAVGAVEDGQIGPLTLAMVAAKPAPALIDQLCDMRLAFLRRLPDFPHFGGGWTARVADVRFKAKGMTT